MASLIIALGFAALLECALVVTFIWPEMAAPSLRAMVWLSVVGVWLYVAAPYFISGGTEDDEFAEDADLFLIAQSEYLKGNWNEAENALASLLARERFDADARLMLATLYRRTGYFADARQQLDKLEQSVGGEKWQLEIDRERLLLLNDQKAETFREAA